MKLFEHPEFEQAILNAEEHFWKRGLKAPIIEKDYYVTEALRRIAQAGEGRVIFKGGTSLSKGWNLIQRFSEDIDIYVARGELRTRALDRELKKLRDAVATHQALSLLPEESQTIGGFGRNDRYSYTQRFGGVGTIANRVLLEVGTASGTEPVETRELRSYLAEFLSGANLSLGAEDEIEFQMPLLHFRRTFVEKLFAIHGKVEAFKRTGQPIGSYARHYYDLSQLGGTPAVVSMLASAEYAAIKDDYDNISKTYFSRDYRPPKDLSFASSDALFPTGALKEALGREYEAQCKILCYGPFPTWVEVTSLFGTLRTQL